MKKMKMFHVNFGKYTTRLFQKSFDFFDSTKTFTVVQPFYKYTTIPE